MATVLTGTINAKNPAGRASVVIDPRDYWNEAFNRPKSGYFKVNVTGVTWSYTGGSTEKAHVSIGLPNANEFYDTLYEADKTVSDASFGTFDENFKVAWNYGQPGPNSRVNVDGTVALVDVNFKLKSEGESDVSSLVGTATYTVTFVEYDPYTALSESWDMDSLTHTLSVGKGRDFVRGYIPALGTGDDVLVIQLRSLATTYADFDGPDESNEAIFCVAPTINERMADYALAYQGVSKSASRTVTYRDSYTYVYAINDGKYDQGVASIVTGGTALHCPCMTGLKLNAGSKDEATVVLSYDIAEDPTVI